MSGIFGGFGDIDAQIVQCMASRLAHRGSKTTIKESAGNFILGSKHNDSITGLAEKGSMCLVGQSIIYEQDHIIRNFGVSADCLGDPSAILLSIYNDDFINKLNQINGQFSFCLWDDKHELMLLVRDYTGTHPLYYATTKQGTLLFASEYKALLCHSGLTINPDLDMVQRLQHYKHLPSDRNLILEIKGVPPGTMLTFNRAGVLIDQQKMPGLSLNVSYSSIAESQRKVSATFEEAIRHRTTGFSRIGVALSGGIDSVGVACACHAINPDAEIHAFTAGNDEDDPEIVTARFVAEKIGAIHHTIIVTPEDILDSLAGLVWQLENPIARTEALQFYKIGQIAGDFVDIMITGAAADGLFGGMPKHKILWLMHLFPIFRQSLAEFYNLTQSGLKPKTLIGKLLDRLYFNNSVPAVPHITGSQFVPAMPNFPANSKEFINDVLCGLFQEGVSQWLPKIERTMQTSGVGFSSPFLERHFIETAFTIPSEYKIKRGNEKFILRQALRNLVPAEVLQIPKFPMKMKHDSSFSDVLENLANQILSKERIEKRGWFSNAEIRNLIKRDNDKSYSSEGAMRIWTAILTEIWAMTFLDGKGQAPIDLHNLLS